VLVSSADETAFAVQRQLSAAELRRPEAEAGGVTQWISSGDTDVFAELGRRLLGPELDVVTPHRWEQQL